MNLTLVTTEEFFEEFQRSKIQIWREIFFGEFQIKTTKLGKITNYHER